MELMKHSLVCRLSKTCDDLSNILENHVNEIHFVLSILLPIQKPNKKRPTYESTTSKRIQYNTKDIINDNHEKN